MSLEEWTYPQPRPTHDTSDCRVPCDSSDSECDCSCHRALGSLDTQIQDILGMPRRS